MPKGYVRLGIRVIDRGHEAFLTVWGWGVEGIEGTFPPFCFPAVSSLKMVSTPSRDFQGMQGMPHN